MLAAAACWRAAMLALAASATSLSPMLAGLVLQEVAFGLTEPVLAGWTNEHVPSERRATLLLRPLDVLHARAAPPGW